MTAAWWMVGLGGGALLVTWVAYPLAVIGLARRRHAAGPVNAPSHPLVSVLVATREPVEQVRARLDDLVGGAWPPERLELVVAEDRAGAEADYDLPATIGAAAVVVVPGDPPGGKAAALNAAARAARGEVLVFADVHQRFDPDAITRLVAALSDPSLGAVSGALRLEERQAASPVGRYWSAERRLRQAEASLHSTIGATGAIWAMRRALWRPLPPGLLLDDVYPPMRLVLDGWRVGFEPQAVAREPRVTSAGAEFRRKVRTLTGNLQLCAWLPDVLRPHRNPVWLQFVCHKLLRLLTPYALIALTLGAGLLVLAGARESLASLAVAAAGALAWSLLSPDRWAGRARAALGWGVAMQAAVVVATLNGLRGRWDVWRP